MPEPYEPHIAITKIRSVLATGRLVITNHCREQMRERNVDDLDIRKVLEENGTITSEPKWDDKHQKWKYRLDGHDIEGVELSLVVNIVEVNCIVVTITVF